MIIAGVAVLVVRATDDSGGVDQRGAAPTVTLPAVGAGSAIDFEIPGYTPPPAAATPADAVEAFLDAEVAGDASASFGQLSGADRATFGSPDAWADVIDEHPGYLTYSFDPVAESDGSGSTDADSDDRDNSKPVVVDVTYSPELNEVVGLIPGAASIEFVTVAEDGGHRIALDQIAVTPRFPSRAAAADSAARWITAAQSCEADAMQPFQYDGSILGRLGFVESLCGSTATTRIGEPGDLEQLADPTAIFTAFGEAATQWAAVVDVTELPTPNPVQLVLAPLGDTWVVVGAF